MKYLLPIETIHEHLVQAAQNPHIEKCEKLADQTRRYFSTVVNRAKRGEYKNRAELDVALDPMHHRIGMLSEQWYLALTPSIQKMVELRQRQPAAVESSSQTKWTLPIPSPKRESWGVSAERGQWRGPRDSALGLPQD
jgi:hypothetical protein